MARPPVRRQILFPPSTTTSQTSPSKTTQTPATPTSTSTSTGGSVLSITNTVTSVLEISSSSSSLSRSTTSSSVSSSSSSTSSSVSSVTPSLTPPLSTTGSDDPLTITQTSSATVPPASGAPESRGKSFLQNKPLSGFVFGLAGLGVLIIVFIAVTSFVRRRNRKRLLADASNFSFDPKDVEDGHSDEKHSYTDLVSQPSSASRRNNYPPSNRPVVGFAGVGTGSISRARPPRSPPVPAYTPQDYPGYDTGRPVQPHNLNNIPVGYKPTPGPYEAYGPRNDGQYPYARGQRDLYSPPGPKGAGPIPDPRPPVPLQLQPGIRPTQIPNFAPQLTSASPPPLNRSPPIPLTTLAPLSDTFGHLDSDDADDDAYSGAFLGPESPPGQRTLQVANL